MGPLTSLALLALLPQDLPPLGFFGFRAGMPASHAARVVESARGELRCHSSSDPRLRECTGVLPHPDAGRPLELLISLVHDSAAVIVLSGTPSPEVARAWIEDLTIDFGRPRHSAFPESQHTWQWIRRGRMMRVVVRTVGDSLETSVTLTHGPLLDGLGPPAMKKPD